MKWVMWLLGIQSQKNLTGQNVREGSVGVDLSQPQETMVGGGGGRKLIVR